MDVDYLIVGQGICGTMLSWFLYKEGKSFLIVDDENTNTASRIAAGVINPVTGRRYAYTWLIEEIMPFALKTYEELGQMFDLGFISEKTVIDFFPSPQMRNAFVDRLVENDTYLRSYPDQNFFNSYFTYEFGCGEISPAYIVHLKMLLDSWRSKLIEWNSLEQSRFDVKELSVQAENVIYKNIRAQKIIFCDGIYGLDNPWFRILPFAPNKGEALIIECHDFPDQHIFKKGLLLTPMSQPGIFWVGSNYQWNFTDEAPSEGFYQHALAVLNGWLKKPFTVLRHVSGVRPATLERRPFVGLHPVFGNVGIFNGMGTKGASLAPFFASQLVKNLVYSTPISPEADVNRFHKLLTK